LELAPAPKSLTVTHPHAPLVVAEAARRPNQALNRRDQGRAAARAAALTRRRRLPLLLLLLLLSLLLLSSTARASVT
jgi:hypothetical protein